MRMAACSGHVGPHDVNSDVTTVPSVAQSSASSGRTASLSADDVDGLKIVASASAGAAIHVANGPEEGNNVTPISSVAGEPIQNAHTVYGLRNMAGINARVCKKCFDHPSNTPCRLTNIKCSKCSKDSHHSLVCVPLHVLQNKYNLNRMPQTNNPTTRQRRQ